MVGEIGKAIGQWILGNVGWTVIIILFLLSCFFKIAKKEIDPLGWVISLIGKPLTKEVRKDIANWKKDANKKFDEIKVDRAAKVKELKDDYNKQISDLRDDLDSFEKTTNKNICDIQEGTFSNCKELQKRLNEIQKSNDMQTVRQIRAHVLDFANSCMNNRQHTKREFDNIINENTQYEALVKKYKIKNAVYKEDYAYILKIYHENQANNSFLKDNNNP